MINGLKDVFESDYWNVHDQNYWIKMNGYGFPTSRMLAKYAYIIDNGLQDVFEVEYQKFLISKEQYTTEL
jgi:hypothetical protein